MRKPDNSISDPTVHLPPPLDEFRTALQDEIEVAKRNTWNSSIPLSNGHKVGTQGNAHQYAFLIDTILNTPDGSPCDLTVPGRVPMGAAIVSIEGLRIIISVENDLGQYVPEARLQTNLVILMHKLIERIEDKAVVNNTVASRMLGKVAVSGTPKKPSGEPSVYPDQMDALESALGRNMTVIWGPPGTGKTYTIGVICEQLYKMARTVLVVSHTNIAVDQAIKHIAKSLKADLEQGAVIRVGEVRDEELKLQYPDILVKEQVERKSKELVERQEALTSERDDITVELSEVTDKVSILEWLQTAKSDIEWCSTKLEEIHKLEKQLDLDESSLAELELQRHDLLDLHNLTSKIIELRQSLVENRNNQSRINEQLSSFESRINDARRRCQQQESRLEIVDRITPLRKERAAYPSLKEQREIIGTLSSQIAELEKRSEDMRYRYEVANNILSQVNNSNNLMRILKRLPKLEEQRAIVNELSNRMAVLETEIRATRSAQDNARGKLTRILELDAELSRYRDIGNKSDELKKQHDIQNSLQHLEHMKSKLDENLVRLRVEFTNMEREEKKCTATLGGDIESIHTEVYMKLEHARHLKNDIKSRRSQINKLVKEADITLNSLLARASKWISATVERVSQDEKLNLLCECYHGLLAQHSPSELPSLTDRVDSLRSKIHELTDEITGIDEQLAKVESDVIRNASVVGATLTKTYLSDDIQARRFDTVILDEASMASIPALYIAALLSNNNLVIVGDFKQLAPIVLSNKESTVKWLGRDIFEVSGLKAAWDKKDPPDYFVKLTEQGRFVPEIAEVANQFYDGALRTRHGLENSPEFTKFSKWYRSSWSHDNPVVLIDTGSLNAWVTSVVKYGNSSRLNLLSATVSVDLAEQLLNPERPNILEADHKRILIVSPYKAHANLVRVLLQENDQIGSEVVSGTAHSFQGSEADVVIFDLVADEPHFRVNLFMPKLNEEIKRLMNVALTRAKFRLFVLGDFDYCRSHASKAFLGKRLLPFLLKSFPRINASDIVQEGLAARAAKAQMTLLGGEIEPDSERVVMTQADFFRLLSTDLTRARENVVIYSPFMTQDRVAFLMPQLRAAVSRGVSIVVITKSISERPVSQVNRIRKIETQLTEIGVVIVHKMHMHEKLVFIDDDITWAGSLNPLSFSNTQEVMERRRSKAVLNDYFQILRLRELLAVLGKPESRCPIHGSEMIVAEGRKDPYYWRCIHDDCYTRSIDQPYPFDGVLSCSACNAPVKFGYWGDYPHWRCTANVRHRQRVFKCHLRLPRMVALIPKEEQRKICKIFGIANLSRYAGAIESITSQQNQQGSFFNDFKGVPSV